MIALIDYGAGNLQSVANALTHLDADFKVVSDPDGLADSEKIVFPGVGAAASCMQVLQARGFDQALTRQQVPVLGICLGMQLFTEWSEEGARRVQCLGVVPGHTARFVGAVKRPQIGWNTIRLLREDPLFTGVPSEEYFYFAHSYRVHTLQAFVLAETEYGDIYPSVIRRDNFWGVQFHPEKSGSYGLRILQNFVEKC